VPIVQTERKLKFEKRDRGQKTQDRQKTKDKMAAKRTKITAADDQRLREDSTRQIRKYF